MTAGVPSEESLPLSAELRIDAVCQRFEAAWKAVEGGGARPAIEAYLGCETGLERPALLRRLLALELHYRKRQGERPTREEYRSRFPEHGELLEPLLDDNTGAEDPLPQEALTAETARCLPGQETGVAPEGTGPEVPSTDSVAGPELPSIPGYEVLAELGRGGMGVVYKARHLRLKRIVALKMILGGALVGPEHLARFRTEAEAVARLQHPNIVQIYEIGEHNGLPFLALEFVDGGSLRAQLGGNPQQPTEAARVVETLAEAMHAAHQADVVHRDLKPANVLLTRSGAPKVTDFGLAKQLDDPSGPTRSGAIMGTPSYMAPEQAAGKKDIGPAADVYALGAILYECLTGRPPFRGATLLDTVEQVRTQEPVRPRALQPKLPRDLETVCLKCLQKEPGKRYATTEELADDLRRWLAGEPIRARPVGALERAWRWALRRPATAALLAVSGVAALALAGAAVAYFDSKRLKIAYQFEAELRSQAEQARQGEKAQRQQTDQALVETQAAQRAEGEARKREQVASAQAELYHYFHRIALAHAAWPRSTITRTEQLLGECPEADRGWEWFYLRRLCHGELLDLRGHESGVTSVAFSPDGKLLASGSNDRTVRVWDNITGREIVSLKGHTGEVGCTAWSADGKRLASASSQDGTVRIWDAATGREQHLCTLRGRTNRDTGRLAFSPDGKLLASGGQDWTVTVWDAETGEAVCTCRTAADIRGVNPGAGIAFSPDGRRLASSDLVGLRVWDTATGRLTLTLRGHTHFVRDVAFSPDGRRLASGAWDPTIRVWDTTTGREILRFRGHATGVESVAFSPDGRRLATAGRDHTIRVWDSVTGQELFMLRGHTGVVRVVSFSPDGRRLASAGEDKALKEWDATNGQEALSLTGHVGAVSSVAFSPDGKQLASAGLGGAVRVWDPTTGLELFTFPGPQGLNRIAFSPDGRWIAGSSTNVLPGGDIGVVKVWEAATGREVCSLKGAGCVAFDRDSKRLATASGGTAVKVWDLASRQEVLTIDGHAGFVLVVAFSPDGRRIASTHGDGAVRLWDAATGREVLRLKGHGGPVFGVAFSPDGGRLASASQDGTVRLWDAAEGKEVLRLLGHTGEVRSVAFSHDGRRLASASTDGDVKIWDAATGQEALTLRGHSSFASSVAFSPDSRLLASAGFDNTVKIWDATEPTAESRAVRVRALAEKSLAWHGREAEAGERDSQWFAVAFHRRYLVEAEPDNRTYRYRRGFALARSGKRDEARAEYAKVIGAMKQLPLPSRIEIHGELGEWDKAGAELAEAVEGGPVPAEAWLLHALVRLKLGDMAGYRKACATLIERLSKAGAPPADSVAWICVLGPGATADPQRIVNLAERAAADDPANPARLVCLGAALDRAGRFGPAVERLTEAAALQEHAPTTWLCLAMAYHGLGKADEAKHWLGRAVRWTNQAKAGSGGPATDAPLSWEERLQVELFRAEAEALVQGKVP